MFDKKAVGVIATVEIVHEDFIIDISCWYLYRNKIDKDLFFSWFQEASPFLFFCKSTSNSQIRLRVCQSVPSRTDDWKNVRTRAFTVFNRGNRWFE